MLLNFYLIILLLLLFFLETYNYIFVLGKIFKTKKIIIDNIMVKRINTMVKLKKKTKFNSLGYSFSHYLVHEKDLMFFGGAFFIATMIYINMFFSFEFNFKNTLIYGLFFYVVLASIHHIFYKKKRIMTDCVVLMLRSALKIKNKYKCKNELFIGKLFFVQNNLMLLVPKLGKWGINYKCYELTEIGRIKCIYKENTVVATIETKDDTCEREFSKFIFESDQVEKDYFEALYEFPFMEKSTVYDFERLHHDIMQDLVDEERTFYFKDYLIKEKAS